MTEPLLRFAYDLSRYAVEASERLDAPELRALLGEDQADKIRGLLGALVSCGEQLVGRRPLPMLLEVTPATSAELMARLARAGDELTAAYRREEQGESHD